MYRSISTRAPWVTPGDHAHHVPIDDSDLWLAFLTEARQRQASDVYNQSCKYLHSYLVTYYIGIGENSK